MISVEYVPALTSPEQDSHDLFDEVVNGEIASGPAFMRDNRHKMIGFAAVVWAAAFKRAEDLLEEVKSRE